MRISAIVITKNVEPIIRRCLASLRWADEIVVVDSHSTDATVAVARRYTDRVEVRPWPGYVAQKNHAAAAITNIVEQWRLYRASLSSASDVSDAEKDLVAKGAVRDGHLVKVLGSGEITVAVNVTADAFSGSARSMP